MNRQILLITVAFACDPACADNVSAQASAQGGSSSSVSNGGTGYGYGGSGVGYGGTGGSSSSISHGGEGGSGGNGFGGMGGVGGIGQGGSAVGGNATNTGNVQSLNFDQVRQSPAVFMSAPMPTAVCQATAGGFLSFIGGLGVAASFTLDQCEIREEARALAGLGRPDLGLKIMCASAKYTSQLEECKN